MPNEDIQDAVLGTLSAADIALTIEQVQTRLPELLALRDLLEAGDIRKDEYGYWRAAPPPPENEPTGRNFTPAELRRARERYGTTTECPKCGKKRNIEPLFGWRRMDPEDHDIVPQSQCVACRGESRLT